MKKFVSCHAESFKRTQVKGLSAHHNRKIEFDENVFPELSEGNWSEKTKLSFDQLEAEMISAKRAAGKKASNLAFRKDANVMLDNVLTLSRDQVEVVKEKYPDSWQKKLSECAMNLSGKIKKEFGLTPMGVHFHVDEGRTENGEFICNYHAHMTFFNFNFETLEQPLRKMKRNAFSKLQDFAGEAFAPLGFERGQSKEITGKKHLKKNEYVTQQITEAEKKLERLRSKHSEIESEIQSFLPKKAQAELELKKLLVAHSKLKRHYQVQVRKVEQAKEELHEVEEELLIFKRAVNPKEQAQMRKIERLERENAELKEKLGISEPELENESENGLENIMQLPRS